MATLVTSGLCLSVANETAGVSSQAQETANNATEMASASFPASDVSSALSGATDAAQQVTDLENEYIRSSGANDMDAFDKAVDKMSQMFSATSQNMRTIWFSNDLVDGHSCTWTTGKDAQYLSSGKVRVTWIGYDTDGATILAYARADYDPRTGKFGNGSFDSTMAAKQLEAVTNDSTE